MPFFSILTGNISVRFKTIIQTIFLSILTGKFVVSIEKTQANLVFSILTENIPVRIKTIVQTFFFNPNWKVCRLY